MSEPNNVWTDERVELLRKLWGDGLSASQIAGELGGVSRNAVIGKVHRLGLSGRTKPPAAATGSRPRKEATPRAATTQPVSEASVEPQAPQPFAPAFEEAAIASTAPVTAVVDIEPVDQSGVVVPTSERVTIMDLREYMCRWPMGDPTSPNFRFCGARAVTGMPYCAHHASIAYQPVIDRRRDRKRA